MNIAWAVAKKLIKSYIEHGYLNRDGTPTSTDAAIVLQIATGSRSCDAATLTVAGVSGDNRVFPGHSHDPAGGGWRD